MVDLIALTNALVTTFRAIPELVSALDNQPANVIAYLDENPVRNSLGNAIYKMAPGTILVAWVDTGFEESEIPAWQHTHECYIKARRGGSPLELATLLANGLPQPGDGRCWRFCPVMDAVLPTQIMTITRVPDPELIDYFVVSLATQETGDANV